MAFVEKEINLVDEDNGGLSGGEIAGIVIG